MEKREKILKGIVGEPFQYMYLHVHKALEIGVPTIEIVYAIESGLKNRIDAYKPHSKRLDFYQKKIKAIENTLKEIELMRISPHPLINRSIDELSRVIVHAVRYGIDSAECLLEKKSVNFEGVIIDRCRTGEWDVRLISHEDFREFVEEERKATSDYACQLLADSLW